ncbi:acyl carrier protein [Nonomuraea angiospora]|jgi:acyl carrier protein|uniref:acyl carrier protein n=1 Tax=Nonomuraea TaxID=83681 RepID=UPI00344A5A0A
MASATPTRDELRDFFAEELELPADVVGFESDFQDDLGVDSLATMEILVQLEKKYGIRLDESEFAGLTSVNAVHAFLADRLEAA